MKKFLALVLAFSCMMSLTSCNKAEETHGEVYFQREIYDGDLLTGYEIYKAESSGEPRLLTDEVTLPKCMTFEDRIYFYVKDGDQLQIISADMDLGDRKVLYSQEGIDRIYIEYIYNGRIYYCIPEIGTQQLYSVALSGESSEARDEGTTDYYIVCPFAENTLLVSKLVEVEDDADYYIYYKMDLETGELTELMINTYLFLYDYAYAMRRGDFLSDDESFVLYYDLTLSSTYAFNRSTIFYKLPAAFEPDADKLITGTILDIDYSAAVELYSYYDGWFYWRDEDNRLCRTPEEGGATETFMEVSNCDQYKLFFGDDALVAVSYRSGNMPEYGFDYWYVDLTTGEYREISVE